MAKSSSSSSTATILSLNSLESSNWSGFLATGSFRPGLSTTLERCGATWVGREPSACLLKDLDNLFHILWLHNGHHTNTHVQSLQYIVDWHTSGLSQPLEYLRNVPSGHVNLCTQIIRDCSWNILNKSSSSYVSKSKNEAPSGSRKQLLDVNSGWDQNLLADSRFRVPWCRVCSLTFIATRSIPTVLWISMIWATLSFVPTPSVAATRRVLLMSVYPALCRSNKPPNPPISESAPGLLVDLTLFLIFSTSWFPASTETPASS
ncbi:hypothetical protein OGATHE_004562 [Ogataea polymorpha]|uniref:Uncharacterized protein n=1 Tax=Ogataea polymorpha TaxID=460523 RepID=A0A9P8T1W5_9ASCO|nr:hypothetical protein OGATHE_004562 [Ogataea polymorpha]